MRAATLLGALALIAVTGGATLVAHEATDPDDDAIRATVQHYFDSGMEMRKAFYPEATMWYVNEGKLNQVPIQDFLKRVEAAAGQPEGDVQKRIVSIDKFGTAAVAKLELKRPDMVIYDYMSLMKVEGNWTIVNKIFARESM